MSRIYAWALLIAALFAGCTSATPAATPTIAPATSPAQLTTASPRPAPTALASPHGAYPPQPDDVPFPADEWPEGEWPAGVDIGSVDEAVATAFADGGSKRLRAVVIIYRGKLIYERYSPSRDDGPEKLMPSYSMAKSFTSALVGILVRDGRMDVYAPAAVPAWSQAADARAEITVDQLLRMTSGLRWSGAQFPDPESDLARMLNSEDAAAYAAAKALAHQPGTTFEYANGNTILVNRIQADLVGSGSEFREFARTELLDKIGIRRIEMLFDPAGTWLGAISADTTARNFAKFGLLYLRDGVWDGDRILPEGWVDYSRTPTKANPEYGAGWWLDLRRPGVFYSVGTRGQVIAVDPAHDLTFVTLATDGPTSLPVSEAILDAFAAAD